MGKEILYSLSLAYGNDKSFDSDLDQKRSFKRRLAIDNYISFLWTLRWRGCGDFELIVPYSKEAGEVLIEYTYVQWERFPRVLMQVREVENTYDADDGPLIIVRGKSLECLFEDRVIYMQTLLSSSWIDAVKRLIYENAGKDPTGAIPPGGDGPYGGYYRLFPGLVIDPNGTYPDVQEEAQFTGGTLYDALDQIHSEWNVGYSCFFDFPNITFSTYLGVERRNISFFFENGDLISSRYIRLFDTYFNLVYVAGDGEGASRKTIELWEGTAFDEPMFFSRHESFLDQRNMSSTGLTTAKYQAQLKQKGKDALQKANDLDILEAEVTLDKDNAPVFDVHYHLGYIFAVADSFGNAGKFRLVEMVISVDEADNYLATPTFINIKEEQT